MKILDIAAGTGNYLFDVINKYPDVEVVANDFLKSNIEVGEQHIKSHGIKQMRFTNYDCFDTQSYQWLNFKPNIVVVSGIFELFENNEQVMKAIDGLASIAEPNATIIYTGQPWHPQLKTIAYVLKSHQNTDWVMRRRSQNELDNLFASAEISKKEMLIDDFGIFTVSLGQLK